MTDMLAEIAAATGTGRQLPGSLRDVLERGLGADLSAVRVHTGPAVDRLTGRMGADGFACGSNIYLRDGAYRPREEAGARLIAHEAAHVVQQAAAGPADGCLLSAPDDAREAEADRLADRALAGLAADPRPRTLVRPGLSGLVQRHLSFEHRFLGDMRTADVRKLWTSPSDRAAVLSNQLDLLLLWERRTDVSAKEIHQHCDWIDVVELGPHKIVATYGELNALPDYLSDGVAFDSVDPVVLVKILQTIRQEGYNQLYKALHGTNPGKKFDDAVRLVDHDLVDAILESSQLDELTSGLGPRGTAHYTGLLARNACHFAPYTWYRWQASHVIARDYAARYFSSGRTDNELLRRARVYHGYADHFLQDSFAAGHLVNKTLVMQWFVEWAAAAGNEAYQPVDWNAVKGMNRLEQPNLVNLQLYVNPWTNGLLPNDPQAVQEVDSVIARIARSGVRGSASLPAPQAYQNYLTFLAGSLPQLGSAALHDHFNETSVWVTSQSNRQPREIWGDDTLLSRDANRATGAAATSTAAVLSRQALAEIASTGSTSISVQRIFDEFPTSVGTSKDQVVPIATWALSQQALCQEKIFPDLKTKLRATKAASPRLGIVSRDQAFANVWYRRISELGFPAAHTLVYEDRVYVGAGGWIWELDAESGRVLHSLQLGASGDVTQLATDGKYIFVGVNSYVYGVLRADNWQRAAWRTQLHGVTTHPATLLYSGGQLYAGSNGWVYKIDPSNGGVARSLRLSAVGIETSLATDGTWLFAGVYGYAYAVRIAGSWGAPDWSTSLEGLQPVTVLSAGGHVYAGSDGYAYELNRSTGHKDRSIRLRSVIGEGNYQTRLATDGLTLFVGSHGYVYGLPVSGAWTKATWTTSLHGYEQVDLLVDDGRLFIGSNGYAYQLEPTTGGEIHSLLLSLGIGLGDYRTQLATDGTYLYGGAHGYAYKITDNDSWLGVGTLYRDALTRKGWQGSWVRPANAPGSVRSIDMAMGPHGNMETFAITVDGTLHHTAKGPTGKWEDTWTPNFCQAPPMQTVRQAMGPQGLEVLGVDLKGVLQHNQLTTTIIWQPAWNAAAGAPMGLQHLFMIRDPYNLHVLGIGTGGVLYHTAQSAQRWTGVWTPNFRNAPALRSVTGRFIGGNLELFAVGIDNGLYHLTKDDDPNPDAGWNDWAGRFLNAVPMRSAAIGARPGSGSNVYLFCVGTDNRLHIATRTPQGWSGNWMPPGPWGLPPVTSVTAGVGPQQNLEVFAVLAQDGALYHTAEFPTGWQNFWSHSFDHAPLPVSSVAWGQDANNDLNVFLVREV